MHLLKKRTFKYYLLTILLIFSSLANHSGNTVIISSIISVIIFLSYSTQKKLNKKTIILFLLSLLFIVFSGLFFLLKIPYYIPADEFTDSFFVNFIKYLFLAIFIYTFSSYINLIDKNDLSAAFKILILVHISFFYLQFATVYITGNYIDFVQPFTDEDSRYLFYGASTAITLYRCTGLYVEPSTYAVSIFIIYCIFSLYNKNNNIIRALSLLSIFLTFSSIGFILIILYTSFNILKNKRKVLLAMPFIIMSIFLFFPFIQTQVEKADNTSSIRVNLVTEILNRDTSLFIFGSGLYAIEQHIMEGSKGYCPDNTDCSSTINRQYASPTDSGLFFYLFIKFGVITIPILIFIIYPFRKSYSMLTNFTCVLLTKIQFAFPLIWLMIVIYRKRKS